MYSQTFFYIYAFIRHFYPKRRTVHSGYTFFISMCVPLELNPQPFALSTQCSTTEPQEHLIVQLNKSLRCLDSIKARWIWLSSLCLYQINTNLMKSGSVCNKLLKDSFGFGLEQCGWVKGIFIFWVIIFFKLYKRVCSRIQKQTDHRTHLTLINNSNCSHSLTQ